MNAAVQVGMDGAVATIDAAPKIFGNWGAEHAPALANIIRDLAKDSAKVYDGRKVAEPAQLAPQFRHLVGSPF